MTSGKPSPLVLLANAHAEETKLISTTLRGFFPDCRLEAVYTSEEALQWSLRDDWNLILVDDALSPRTGAEILHELKRNSPRAAIILQTDRHDSAAALQALQQGADFLLFKESPGYVTELLFYTQEALEKRELESKLDQTFQRHLRLLESVSDLVYELDHEGRFVYVSPTVTSLLGYAPEELAGRHFSFLLPPAQERIAQYHMNERRAGARSAHQLELYVLRKSSEKKKDRMALMQLTAKGLYDERHRYLGTVGLLRDLSSHQEQVGKVQTLEAKLQEVDRQLAASRNAVLSSQHLHQPLSALLEDSQRLLATLQSIQFDQHVKQLATYAARATEMGYEVWRAVQFSGRHTEAIAINDILRHVIGGLAQDQLLDAETVEERFSPTLPHIIGHAEDIKQLFRILILYALQAPAGTPTGARLLLETYVLKSAGSAAIASPAMISPPLTPYIVTIIRQGTVGPATTIRLPIPSISGAEFLLAHDIVHRHSGSIEIDSPTSRLCRIAVRLPATLPRPVSGISESSAEKTQGTQPLSSTSSVTPALRSDRRRFERIRLRVPLHVSIGTTVWQGTMLDIGLGGILVAFTQPIPP
ncbi:MAG TPA: PAS domain S-box protein, partial [Nitrospiraceae bacterium]|nr:PAS domain S-box protein [Nitrospiraceae bacterium]